MFISYNVKFLLDYNKDFGDSVFVVNVIVNEVVDVYFNLGLVKLIFLMEVLLVISKM